MGWGNWFSSGNGEACSKDVGADSSKSGHAETHHISTAGGGKHHSGGGDRDNHSHTIIQHKSGGAKSAHSAPHKKNR